MPHLTIRIKKKADGSAALSCIRLDGTVTWHRQDGSHGAFFPLHDLTHYAVETVLGHRKGFYGLVAGGWDITDFGRPWPRGPIPPDADPSELIVGFLDTERAAGARWTTGEFNKKMADYYRQHALPGSPPPLTDSDLQAIRARRAELFERWRAVPAGEALELAFPDQAGVGS